MIIKRKNFGLNTSEANLGLVEIERKNFAKAEIIYQNILKRKVQFGKQLDILNQYLFFMNLYFIWEKKDLAKEYYSLIINNDKGQLNSNQQLIEYQQVLYYANLRYGQYLKRKKGMMRL